MRGTAVTPTPFSHVSPRSYDVGLLFCIRAINLAWPEIEKHGADQFISQWIIQGVCYFHTVTDEGPNPRRPCPTDVEMQPMRELSSSASPQRSTSQRTSSHLGGAALIPQVDTNAVDFSMLHSDGLPLHSLSTAPEGLSISHISAVDMTLTEQTPQPGKQPFPRMQGFTTASKSSYRPPRWSSQQRTECFPSPKPTPSDPVERGGGGGGGAMMQPFLPLDQHRHHFHNKGFMLILELLSVALDVNEAVFQSLLQSVLAVLPRPLTTHAEISLAIFENYPYIPPWRNQKSRDGPEILIEAAANASGNAMKSFLVYMNVVFNSGSFERQCEVLEMCKKWRTWMEERFSWHLISTPQQTVNRSDLDGDAFNHFSAAQAQLRMCTQDDSTLIVDRMVREAMLSKDVHAVANTVHRFYEHRLGAEGTGKAILELLLHPTHVPVSPQHPLSFLFGVTPAHQSGRIGGGAGSGDGGGSGNGGDIHTAISCGILVFGMFYLSMRSGAAAQRCAEMAVLNGHQSGLVDTLALAHLLRSKSHAASGNSNAAAEDISIALQLSAPVSSISTASSSSSTPMASPQPMTEWWTSRALAFLAAAEALLYYPAAIDDTLRCMLMQAPVSVSSSSETSRRRSSDGGPSVSGTEKRVEVIQSLAHSVRHALWCAEVAMLEECGSLSVQAVGTIMCRTLEIAASALGVSSFVSPCSEEQLMSSLALFEEDRIVMPEHRMVCTPASLLMEAARQAVVCSLQYLSGEYQPILSSPGTTSSIVSSYNPMTPFMTLLSVAETRCDQKSVEILERCFHFSVAVELTAATTLWERGYATVALHRLVAVRTQLLQSCGSDVSGGAASLCWSPECLALLVQCSRTLVEVHLFFGSKEAARKVIDDARNIATKFGYVRGVLVCNLMLSHALQSERRQSEQLQLLEEVKESAMAIGYVPLAAQAHLSIVAAHCASSKTDDACAEMRHPEAQRWASLLRRSHKLLLMHRLYSVVLTRNEEQLAQLAADVQQQADGLPLTTVMTVTRTLAAVAIRRNASRELINALQGVASNAMSKLQSRQWTDAFRGLGDSLQATCAVVTEYCTL